MRHSVHIMFGKASSEALLKLKEYISKFGEGASDPFFNGYLCYVEEDKSTIISKAIIPQRESSARKCSTAKFSIDSDDVLNVTPDKLDNHLLNFFRQLYSSTIRIGNTGDFNSLHVCLYVGLYDSASWELAQKIITVAKEGELNFDIDIIGFHADMAEIFIEKADQKRDLDITTLKAQTNDTIKKIVKFKGANPGYISHLLMIQNTQNQGASLNLSLESFTRIIGEFAMATIERYTNIFIPIHNDCDLQTFGLSMISLDKHYFVEYLLTNVYLHIMDREGISQKTVDINMAISKSSPLLKKWRCVMSDIYDNEVKPRIDNGESQLQIISNISSIIESKFVEMGNDLGSFIKDEELSIPDKKAILATLIGKDDKLLENTVFDQDRLVLNDLDSETMNLFIKENNLLLDTKFADDAILSPDNEPIVNPLPEMNELRKLIQMSAGHIRSLQSENEKLESQLAKEDIVEKCLIKDGFFVIGGEKYRVLPDDDQGEALKETYIPHEVRSKDLDLRSSFTDIKSQGQQGSCMAFATTSMLEYMLKSNDDPKPDLSEAFLYYNTRLKDNVNEDKGSRIDYALESLVEYGICTEDLCPYSDKIFNVKPTAEAYEEAKGRKVKKVLKVNTMVEDVKSAIEDGYPVGVSLNLYESFGKGANGFIATPTAEEIARGKGGEDGKYRHGRHAMVVCGYSDKDKLFVVRNSWGQRFGDGGYCYMSYLYFENKELFNHAWIVTEISKYKVNQQALNVRFSSAINRNDAAVMYAINNNLIDFEKQFHQKLFEKWSELDVAYKALKQEIRDPKKQFILDEGAQKRLANEISNESAEKVILQTNRSEALRNFNRFTIKAGIFLGGAVLLLLLISYLLFNIFGFILLHKIFAGVVGLLVIFAVFFFPWRKMQKRRLTEEFDDQLSNMASHIAMLEKELQTKHLTIHIAGMVLERLFNINDDINSKYKSCKSFLLNLGTWYKEELEIKEEMDANTQPPFISILDNDILSKYYDENRDNISKNVKLWRLLLDYKLSEDGIREFQKALNLKIEGKIANELRDFTIYDYVSEGQEYPFLPTAKNNMITLLSDMDQKSDLFLECNNSDGALCPSKTIMIHTSPDQTSKWNNIFRKAFNLPPVSTEIVSTNKMVIIRVENLKLSQIKM